MADRPDPTTDPAHDPAHDPANGHDEAALAVAARHALHDEELVAALADEAAREGALEATDAARARALVERCPTCRVLHGDLLAIASAHRATAAMTVAAPRDFRITPVRPGRSPGRSPSRDAAQPGLLDRLRAAIGSVGRPLGGTLVAAGLVGLLVGTVNLGAIPAGAPARQSDATLNGAYSSPEGVIRPQGPVPASTPDVKDIQVGSESAAEDRGTAAVAVLAGSSALLVLGLALLVGAPRLRRPSG